MKQSYPLRFVAWARALAISAIVALGLGPRVGFANTYEEAVKTHCETVTRTADAAFATPHLLLKKGATDYSVALCGATDEALGTLSPEAPAGETEVSIGSKVVVHLLGKGDTKKMVASGAVAAGVKVYQAAGGKVSATGTKLVGRSLTPAGADGDLLEVADIACMPSGTHYVFKAGIHAWAGGAATTDSIAVVGLLATDIVQVTLVARAAAETLVMAVNDDGNDQIDLTLSANGTNGTTKLAYSVLRAAV